MARSGCNCKERYGRIRSNREVYDMSERFVLGFTVLLLAVVLSVCCYALAAGIAVMTLMQVAP